MKLPIPFLGFVLLLGACAPSPSSPSATRGEDGPKFPWKGATPPKGRFTEVVVDQASRRRVWLYPPANGQKAKGLIVIAGAGSNLVTGMALTEEDTPEHLPWAKAGYAVAAYDVSGPMPEDGNAGRVEAAIMAFVAREAGVSDGRDALEAGVKAFPEAAGNVIAVGHSSAATLALALAAHDRRVTKCIAFAPVTDVLSHLGAKRAGALARLPQANDAIIRNSPASLVSKLKKPTFLFVAKDDDVVSAAGVEAYAGRLRRTGCPVTFKAVDAGGHYDAMINPGQGLALAWLRGQK